MVSDKIEFINPWESKPDFARDRYIGLPLKDADWLFGLNLARLRTTFVYLESNMPAVIKFD